MAVIHATGENFAELTDTTYAVVDVYSDQCGVCVMLEPHFLQQSNEFPMVKFIKLNASSYPEFNEKLGVTGYPTVLYYYRGREVFRELGFDDRKLMDHDLARLLYGKE